MLSALAACAHEDMTMFYRHVSAIYINSLLSLGHSLISATAKLLFTGRQHILLCYPVLATVGLSVCLSVRLPVRPSVTR